MAYYAYKNVIYRADFQALCEGFSAKYGRELDPDPGYDGDYWSVAADLLEAKDAEIEALKAKLADCQSVLRSRGHHESCDAGWCFHVTTLHPIHHKMGTKYASHVCRPMSACSDACGYSRCVGSAGA